MDIMAIILGIGGLVAGGVAGLFAGKKSSQAAEKEAENNAKLITKEAELKASQAMKKSEEHNENVKQKKILEAKEKFLALKTKHEKEVQQREHKVKDVENRTRDKERDLNKKLQSLDDRIRNQKKKEEEFEGERKEISNIRENLNRQLQIIGKKQEALDQAQGEHIKALESIANLSEAEAKERILKAVEDKSKTEAMALVKSTIADAKVTANKEAKKIVIQSIQRMCAEYTIENTVSVFNLTSDDMKGQIIGREGRNIRALEAATGAEIVVDDTPEAIIISSFDPIRREICRLSLQRLVADGRIHPARIEEVVGKTKKQLEEQIMEIGERTVIDLDIHGFKPDIIRMIGRMRFRSSYGQNLLKHSMETANLCAVMAAEIGLSPKQVKMAKRAGLLHDIGKVADEESELSHAILGMKMCEKAGEHAAILNAVGAHHDEIEMSYIISPIVQACDAISGARPGARREIMESYLKRIKDLEEIALSHEGVQKAYAIQAGRELRVIVESEKVSDTKSEEISFSISERIQNEMQYPGQIKVTVIREMRATSFAK